MTKRWVIWIVVAGAAVGVVLTLQYLKRAEMEQEGRVTYHKKSGDFMQFFAREFEKYGGTQLVATTLPKLQADWRYAEDKNGFQILLSSNKQAELVHCLTQAYGTPILSEGYPHLLYRVKDIGAAICAETHNDPMHIIVLRSGVLNDEKLPIEHKRTGQ